MLKRLLKGLFTRMICRPGTVVTILRGPLRGKRYIADDLSGWSHLYGGWEPDACKVYRAHVRPGQVVYDLGAHAGMHTLLFSLLVGPAGRVYAFEPIPANIERIRRLIELNGLTNVTIVERAVCDRTGTAQFDEGPNSFQGSLTALSGSTARIEVRTISLDDHIDQGHAGPDFMKIDIEGAEGPALAGFERHIERYRPLLAIDLHTPEQDLSVGAFLARHNYRVYRVREHRSGDRQLLTEIPHLDRPWPDPSGIWGTIFARPCSDVSWGRQRQAVQ